MSSHELRDLACQLGHDMAAAGPAGAPGGIAARPAGGAVRARPGNAGAEIRVSMTARSRDELAERATYGARLVRGLRGDGPMISDGGVHVSSGARGRVVLVFPGGVMASGAVPGGAATPAGEAMALARSLGAVQWLAGLGVRPAAAVGYSLGELAGLVWAGSLAAPEAARLLAQHGEVRRGLGAMRTAMARVAAGEAAAGSLTAACGLAVAAFDGPRSHVLAGPVPAVRELIRQASALGVTADVLDDAHALHTPAMAPCAAPLRSVLGQVRFGPPQRRLVSTVTARELTPDDDIAALLCAQLTSPVRFRDAIQVASDGADLIVVIGGDDALTRAAAACGVPAAGLRLGPATAGGAAAGGPAADPGAACAAALLAAGVIPDVAVLSPGPAEPVDIWRDWPAAWRGTRPPAGAPPEPAGARAGAAARGPGRLYSGPDTGGAPVTRDAPAPRRGRFLETVSVFRPGSELVAETRISARTDPYLADYLLDGQPVLPATISLEAMAEAASALAGRSMRSARRVRLSAPVALAGEMTDEIRAVLRAEARVRGDGVETILWVRRDGLGDQPAECARAVFTGPGEPAAAAPAAANGFGMVGGAGAAIVDGADLYGPVCFQAGRFRRVALVSGKRPRSCRAIVRGRDEEPWFGDLPEPAGQLVLGSPGLNDAALQVAQACVPGRRLLPGGCDSLTVAGAEVPGAVELRAYLISAPAGGAGADGDGEYVWDIHGYDLRGHLVIAWIGLRMAAAALRPGSSPADVHVLTPEAESTGIPAHLHAAGPAPVPQHQVESLSRAR